MKNNKRVFSPLFEGILEGNVVSALGFCIPLVVGASTNLRTGVVVCILMMVVNLVVGTLLSVIPVPTGIKAPLATICGMLLIASLWTSFSYFGKELIDMGFYVTLIAVNSILIESFNNDDEMSIGGRVWMLFSQTLGFSLVMILLSALREFMARGSLWGVMIAKGGRPFNFIPTQSIFVGFLLLALLIVVLRLVKGVVVSYMRRGA